MVIQEPSNIHKRENEQPNSTKHHHQAKEYQFMRHTNQFLSQGVEELHFV